MIGKTFKTKRCGDATVIKHNEKQRACWRVRFNDTGYEVNVSKWQITSGQIRDPFKPQVLGIGIPGDVDYSKYGDLAKIWRGLIYRCYDPNNSSYGRYGEVGVTMAQEWLFLPKFISDCLELPGFDWDLFTANKLHLDKDMKQRFQSCKVYSKDTCMWLSPEDNVRVQDGQMKPFKVTDTEGNTSIHYNVSAFAREYADKGFTRRNVSAVLNRSDVKHCFGWSFEYVEPDQEIVKSLEK